MQNQEARPLLFDLYGTLIRPGSPAWIERTAELLELDPARLRELAGRSFQARQLGRIRTPDQAVAELLRLLDRQVDEQTMRALVELRWSFFHTITIYEDSLPALDRLRALGHALALATNCSAETSVALERLDLVRRFDALTLSCEIGLAKPQPEFYLDACHKLGVEPQRCIFVGDGESDEHAGARALSMTTVLIQRPDLRPRVARADYTITALDQLFEIV